MTLIVVIVALVILVSSRVLAGTWIDYLWWEEVARLETWLKLFLYGTVPVIVATLLLGTLFWSAYRLGRPQTPLLPRRWAWAIPVALFVLAMVIANVTIDSWTTVRFVAGQGMTSLAGSYVDPIFHRPLRFYFFNLPFYHLILRVVMTGAIVALLIYWLASNYEALRRGMLQAPESGVIDLNSLSWRGVFRSPFFRYVASVALLGLAVHYFLDRYSFLFVDHGAYLVGVDWTSDHITLPLQWLLIATAVAAAAAVLSGRARFALVLVPVYLLWFCAPPIINALYVRPNELNLERVYIGHHINATRSAYGLSERIKEIDLNAQPEIAIDYERHRSLLDNVRLWDWRAFHDTISQIQPLRPYTFVDSDVDRYRIDGQLRQVLISPRELDIKQLGDARSRWINPHFVYTHGYGIVMAEANKITPDGLPALFIQNAPPEVRTRSLRLTRPQIYYGEVEHEPVFSDTDQAEFDYPSGAQNVHTRYQGTGGFPASSFITRLAAAVYYGDPNIFLTSNLRPGSRMMIRRAILERLGKLAGFLEWDADPFLVLTDEGRLVWMIDGYTTAQSHPYARALEVDAMGSLNYMRNAVKATIDAYSGETQLYVFDSRDPLIAAYERLFPELFRPAAAMPADLRAHARYPETLFNVQADLYRTVHMRDPEAFYNRADLWDIARSGSRQGQASNPVTPTYVVATLPGEERAEFLLITPFTPANKDNLIGFMAARCDGDHLGEIVFQQLAKQTVIYGPRQVEARINQDQVISKDLSLWNQQGSEVLRGQMLVLPIENSFLYVAPIYIQASDARMPQLKKVALGMGNLLAYADTYEQALAQLTAAARGTAPASPAGGASPTAAPATGPAPAGNLRTSASAQSIDALRLHLRRYQELAGQGRWAEAGKELEQMNRLLNVQ